MTISASALLKDAVTLLQDPDSTRWSISFLVDALNSAQRVLMTRRPDAFATMFTVGLVAGPRQSLPTGAAFLVDVIGNTASRKALRKVEASLMDSINPKWQAATGAKDIAHFMYDLRFPRDYYVYPPALPTASLELMCTAYPTSISAPSGATYASVVGNISVADQWAEPLLNWVLYRAWSVDAEFGGNAQLSAGYLTLFTSATEVAASADVAPTN